MISLRIITYLISVIMCAACFIGSASIARGQNWDHAIAQFNQKQYRASIREFHAILKTNPAAWQSWYYIGCGHFQLKEYEDTIDALRNYIKATTTSEKEIAGGYYYIAFSHYQLKQYPESITAFQKYISLTEKSQQKPDPAARAALGRALIFNERYADAITSLTAAAVDMKNNANNYYYIGFAHYKLGRNQLAITSLNQALSIDPKDVDSLRLLGDIYIIEVRNKPEMIKQAISIGERLLAVSNDEAAWRILGYAYLLDKQYLKAAPLFEKYARAHTDSSAAWFNLGFAYSRSSQWKQAAEALEQSIKITPNNIASLTELGYVYESDKQYQKALDCYQRAYESGGRKDDTLRESIDRVKQTIASGQSNRTGN